MTLPPIPEVSGVEHRHETVNGIQMHYAEAGSGEPLVLLHGYPQHWWMWRDFFAPLSKRFRVIAPDLRGHGWTDKPRSSYRKAELAGDIVALLDRLGLDRVRMMGHDWGAVTALLVAAGHPERVEQLVGIGIPHPWQRRPSPVATLTALTYQPVLAGPWGRFAIERGFTREMLKRGRSIGSFTDDELETYEAIQREPDTREAGVRIYRTFMTRELLAWMRGSFVPDRLTTPTLWLVGEKDMLASSADEGYRDHADDMTLERVDGANHFMPEEIPEQVVERALTFFA